MNISLVYYSISQVIPFYQLNYCFLVSPVFLRCVGDIKYCIKRHCIKASIENLTITSRLPFYHILLNNVITIWRLWENNRTKEREKAENQDK